MPPEQHDVIHAMGATLAEIFGPDMLDVRRELDAETQFSATYSFSEMVDGKLVTMNVTVTPHADGSIDVVADGSRGSAQ